MGEVPPELRHFEMRGEITLNSIRIKMHRNLMAVAVAVAVAALALSVACVPPLAMAGIQADKSGATAEVVAIVNRERARAGCSRLTVNAQLMAAALNHSRDMAAHRTMSHTGSDGSDPATRATRVGYRWIAYGENVAFGYTTPQKVMNAWMHSPRHRANILDCSFKEIGVGLAQPNNYWTQTFGTSR
ncbi:CAP domain-containing protein [Streptomyces sp. NPDC005533]|uniref:CAP domain-containing protein n=1 Tax=Streptomyces sp. NPDC005533 TaxID=3364723 RepID=UPI00369255AF